MNPFKTDFGQFISVDFGKSDFLDIDIFISYKALYSACSTIFRHLDLDSWPLSE